MISILLIIANNKAVKKLNKVVDLMNGAILMMVGISQINKKKKKKKKNLNKIKSLMIYLERLVLNKMRVMVKKRENKKLVM